MTTLTAKPLTPETWDDFADLFGRHNGVSGGCWCAWNLCTSTRFQKMTRDERRDFHHQQLEQGQASGMLVYDDDIPVAWCQFGPAALFTNFDRNRIYKTLDIPPEWLPQWRITCLFVDKHRRREGLSNFALHAVLEHIRAHGGGVVEAFPYEIEGVARPSFTGSVAMYEREGFQRVCMIGKVKVLMRRRI